MILALELFPFVLLFISIILINLRIKDHFEYRASTLRTHQDVAKLSGSLLLVQESLDSLKSEQAEMKSKINNLTVKAGIANVRE